MAQATLKRSLFLVLIALLMCSIQVNGCTSGDDDDDNDDDNGSGIVMPLTLNNIWNYSYQAGAAVSGTYSIQVVGDQSVNGVSVKKLDYAGDLYGQDYWIYLQNQSDGLYFYGDTIWGELANPDLWAKYPCSVGDTWQTSGQGGVVNWTVISTSDTVTVAAGTFSCLHVRGFPQGSSEPADHWWSVGIGEVKASVSLGTYDLVQELTSYQLN
ncbi:hypothetical protein ACFL27_24025 [candidate division CSSED10-310 bacterium]|uniref:Uncharacterized protein n=1 Tax=candidate division CSSED10-310 bacterium TaxID=2855610 RepID=A0ABV6Z4B8_UNCC1